jgi:Tol biopolymer transport system component
MMSSEDRARVIGFDFCLSRGDLGVWPCGGNSLFRVDLAGKAVLLRTTSVETWAEPSPDGRWIAFIDRSLDSNVWLLQAK